MTLRDYYLDLLRWEGADAAELIAEWPEDLVAEIQADFERAAASSGLIGMVCPLRDRSSNQSIGNQVAAFAGATLAAKLREFELKNCSGAGYPDNLLLRGDLKIALEWKATSDWNARDSNRRVLISSSQKLRAQFAAPIFHLLATAIYNGDSAQIEGLRLDFLSPTTLVSVRLEASVSHKLLSQATHASLLIS